MIDIDELAKIAGMARTMGPVGSRSWALAWHGPLMDRLSEGLQGVDGDLAEEAKLVSIGLAQLRGFDDVED